MFDGAVEFNQPVDHFKMDLVTTTYQMFHQASKFNQPVT
jgi:hypothetical protein